MNGTIPTAAAVRSPSYPNMPLGEAIAAVAKIEKPYRQSQVDREVAAKIIGYSALSGPAAKALAALANYGLVERAGKGELRVTSRARAILQPDNLNERRENLLAAAFDPDLFRELRDRWPDMIPPEEGVVTYLHRKGFNQSAIRPAMKAYRETLLFLEQEGVSESHGTEPSAGADSSPTKGGADAAFGKVRVGDMVDVEIAGTLLTAEPVKVRAIAEDGDWIFVEGSETGIQMDQVTIRERPAEVPPTLKAPPKLALDDDAPPPPSGSRAESFNTDEGDIRITWPANLSAQSVADMTDWLELLMRRIARRAGVKEDGAAASGEAGGTSGGS